MQPVLVIIPFHLNVSMMAEWTKEQWVEGFRKLQYVAHLPRTHHIRLDTIEKIKAQLPTLREELKDDEKLKQIYKYSFTFYKDPDIPGKNLGE